MRNLGKEKSKNPKGAKISNENKPPKGEGENRGRGDEVGVDVEGHPGALVRRVETLPRREGGEHAVPYWGVL